MTTPLRGRTVQVLPRLCFQQSRTRDDVPLLGPTTAGPGSPDSLCVFVLALSYSRSPYLTLPLSDCSNEVDDDALARLQGQAIVPSTPIVSLRALFYDASWQRHETGAVDPEWDRVPGR